MTGSPPAFALSLSLVGGVVRGVVGILWLVEGTLKYRAGFGAADIGLVVDSTAGNARVPWFFGPVGSVMDALPGVFGVMMPALEVGLGALLLLGIITPLATFASIGTLMLYWSADQLTAAYPAMVVLSALVLLVPGAGRLGVGGWLRARREGAPRVT